MSSQLFGSAWLAKSAGAVCLLAVAVMPVLADDGCAAHADQPVTKPETTPAPDVETLIKECARLSAAVLALKDGSTETHAAAGRKASEACKAAIAASGLSADEFWAKCRSLFEQLRTKPT